MPIEDELRDRLAALASEGAPQVAALSAWVLEHPQEVAFKSVRALAQASEVNSNTVVRLAQTLGFDGYDAFRAAFQLALVERTMAYSARAAALSAGDEPLMLSAMRSAHERNAAALFSPEMTRLTEECADKLLSARRVICVGVRSCRAVAHYFSYVGAMAFPNIAPYPTHAGGFTDLLSDASEQDVVIAVSFKHYSVEVVSAVQLALKQGASVIAMTDSHAAPVARGAWRVLPLEMAGPQFLPSLASAFLLVEILLAEMTLKSKDAVARIDAFENRILNAGGYVSGL